MRFALTSDVDAKNHTGTWATLERIFTLGGSFITDEQRLYVRGSNVGETEFCSPYVYSAFPHHVPGLGEAVAGVLLEADVPIREAASSRSPLIVGRSHEIVKFLSEHPSVDRDGTYWASVETLDAVRGFVRSDLVRSVTDYHACLARIDGQWRLTAFTRGSYP